MAVFVALGAFLMTLAGGWTAQRVTDRRHLVLGLAGGLMLGVVGLDLLPEALRAAGREVFGVPAALLLFVAGFLVAHLVERLLAARQASHGAEETVYIAPPPGRAADRAQPFGPPRARPLDTDAPFGSLALRRAPSTVLLRGTAVDTGAHAERDSAAIRSRQHCVRQSWFDQNVPSSYR